ncbi:MAG TPA: endo-1,4-beta-xylanase [Phycisphaerae bacterium]|nr:endo-1,4-beta-xylanase [Phycisphaerae bacterium]
MIVLGGMLPSARAAEPPDDNAILADAAARIEKHRKADAVARVVDSEGKPIAGATVAIRQTRHAFLFGCNIFMWGQCKTPEQTAAYQKRFADVFNFATLPFYWWSYEPQQGKPQYDRSEQIARWCRGNGIHTKGHPLAWNYSEPKWLPDDAGQVLALQYGRVGDCVTRLHGLIDRWDVVNEAAQYNRDMLKSMAPKLTAAWEQAGQIEFTRRCFEAARSAAPDATLLINDYDTTEACEKLIERLVDGKGKRMYDVIGIQSHMHGGIWPDRKIWEVCERFSRFGVPLHFTETTLLSGEPGWELADKRPGFKWESTPDGLKRQAEQTERFYTILFSHPAVEAVTWWDFSDQGAWQRAPAGWLDPDMSPKPVYDVMRKLIRQTWWTRLDETTDAAGQVRFRGFKGEYRLSATTPDGRKVERSLQVPTTQPAVIQFPRNPGG